MHSPQAMRSSFAARRTRSNRTRSTFGATALAGLARDLELGGLDPVRAAAGAPLDAIEREFTRVAQALTDLKHA